MNLFGGRSSAGAEARAKAKMYGELADTLEEKAAAMTEQTNSVEEELVASHASFNSNADSAEGLLNDTFELHEEMWESDYVRIINNIRMGIAELNSKKASARQLETYWYQIAEMEEARARAGF